DPPGHRVKKVTPTETAKFLYDFERVLQESDGTGSTVTEYTSTEEEFGHLLSQYESVGGSHFFEFDGLGSTAALTDPLQNQTDSWRYRAFGFEQSHTGSTDNVYTFVGKRGYYHDPEIDLYFVRKRYYDPAATRWLNPDPKGFASKDQNLY